MAYLYESPQTHQGQIGQGSLLDALESHGIYDPELLSFDLSQTSSSPQTLPLSHDNRLEWILQQSKVAFLRLPILQMRLLRSALWFGPRVFWLVVAAGLWKKGASETQSPAASIASNSPPLKVAFETNRLQEYPLPVGKSLLLASLSFSSHQTRYVMVPTAYVAEILASQQMPLVSKSIPCWRHSLLQLQPQTKFLLLKGPFSEGRLLTYQSSKNLSLESLCQILQGAIE